ncbi:hypothetical protein B0H66DRAFT_540320 [Apodospora peruviana]|uniref:Zn(2)-C6 fungal-type domain-containing protein n=1 Tax=Apodospora peruviana TaxID=516989 RepID=A0AAE0MFI2_9PEZI|nr:hypothetical protein B0H66DRAFT_540320 [Apodospora peruviana]
MKSIQACRQCRRLKRRCDREKPSCSLCIRLGKGCEYPRNGPTPSDTSVSSNSNASTHNSPGDLLARLERLEGAISGSMSSGDSVNTPSALSSFPASFFLDPDFFVPLQNDTAPTTSAAVQSALSQVLPLIRGDLNSICHSYSVTINQWLSILSPQRLFQSISALKNADLTSKDPALILLLSCLCILVESDYAGPCQEYLLVKSLSSALENEGIISFRLLQALTMLAVYELGHGIYPSAYLTIGRAGRLAMLMGLQDRRVTPHLFKEADTWTLREEERRTWWAIFILDRYCNLTTPGLPLAIPEPHTSFLLPISDMGWRNGEVRVSPSEPSAVLSALTANPNSIGRFATMCQASHLMSLVIKHRDSTQPVEEPHLNNTFRLDEALQLHRTLVALDSRITVSDAGPSSLESSPEQENNLEALALICSARCILYNMYGCNEPDVRSGLDRLRVETEIQHESVKGIIDLATKRVPQMAHLVVEIIATATAAGSGAQMGKSISPTLMHCLYHMATECAWFIREGFGPEMTSGLGVIVSALKQMRVSWAVAGECLCLLTLPSSCFLSSNR